MVVNNCVGSNDPLEPNGERWRSILSQYKIDGRPLFDLASAGGQQELDVVLGFLNQPRQASLSWRVRFRDEMKETYGRAQVITDDNMGGEFTSAFRDAFGFSILPY
jgi:hypothetical protein